MSTMNKNIKIIAVLALLPFNLAMSSDEEQMREPYQSLSNDSDLIFLPVKKKHKKGDPYYTHDDVQISNNEPKQKRKYVPTESDYDFI